MKSLYKAKKNGFTLIELLVVIVVIGVLVAVVIFVINPERLRERARDGVRRSNLIKIITAINAHYAAEGFVPTSTTNLIGVYLREWPDHNPSPTDEYHYSRIDANNYAVWVDSSVAGMCFKYYSGWSLDNGGTVNPDNTKTAAVNDCTFCDSSDKCD